VPATSNGGEPGDQPGDTLAAVLGLLGLLAQRRGPASSGVNASEATGDRTVLSELWAVDATTFKLGERSIGQGREISVDLKNGNYWGAILEPTTMSLPGRLFETALMTMR